MRDRRHECGSVDEVLRKFLSRVRREGLELKLEDVVLVLSDSGDTRLPAVVARSFSRLVDLSQHTFFLREGNRAEWLTR